MSSQLIPINDSAKMQEAGIPFNEHQARWALRQAHQNGLGDAFIRIGRRVFLDPAKFHELVRRHRK